MMHHLDEETLLDLVNGLLPPSDVDAVRDHVRDCVDCERLLQARVAEYERLRSRPVLVARPAAGHGRILRFAAPVVLAAAALLALLIMPGRRDRLPAEPYWIPGDREMLTVRSDVDDAARVVEGVAAYDRRDMDLAFERLAAPVGSGPLDDLRRIYLASAALHTGRDAEALSALQPVDAPRLPRPWDQEARWLRYLALDRLDRTDEARRLLDELAALPGPIGDLARRRRSP